MDTTLNSSKIFAKNVFLVCLIAFALLQIYGLYYDTLRLQFEASSDMVWFSGPGYHTPMYRYAFILNKFLLFPAFWVHVPMNIAAIVYCLNDAFFYLSVSVLIILLTGRYDYASTVLAAPLLIHGQGFYFIVNEIFLSGTLLVAFTAISKYMSENWLKKLILPSLMFFVIWSHPLMIVVLIVFLPFIYPTLSEIRKSAVLILFMLINIFLRLMMLSDYDHKQIATINLTQFTFSYWLILIKDFPGEFSALTVIMASGLYVIFRSAHKWQYIGLCTIPVLLIVCNLYQVVPGDLYFIKFLYPVTLFLLLQGMIYIFSYQGIRRKFVLAILPILFWGSFRHLLYKYHPILYHRSRVLGKLNLLCYKEDAGHSKWFVKCEVLKPLGTFNPTWHTESLFFSSYNRQYPAIQLVRATNNACTLLASFPLDKIFINDDAFLSIVSLNEGYFKIKHDAYKELVLDSLKMKYLSDDDLQ